MPVMSTPGKSYRICCGEMRVSLVKIPALLSQVEEEQWKMVNSIFAAKWAEDLAPF